MVSVAVTAFPSGTPTPFIDVTVTDLGGVSFTVWRTSGGRRWAVRGLAGRPSSGGATGRDYEAPFEVVSEYRVEEFDANGDSLGFSATASATLTGLKANEVWVHDPLDPSQGLKVTALEGFGRSQSRPFDPSWGHVPRRSVGFVFPGTRQGVTGVVLDVVTRTRTDGELFDRMVGAYDTDALGILCFRSRPETWLPATFIAHVGVTLKPWASDGQWAEWSVSGTEVAPPTPAVVVPLLTYADFNNFYATYAAFNSAYATYLVAAADYSIAGL